MFFSLKFKPTGRSAWWLQYNSDEVLFRWTAVLFSALLLRDYLQRNLICKIKWLRLSLQGDICKKLQLQQPFRLKLFHIWEKDKAIEEGGKLIAFKSREWEDKWHFDV